ncbi:MAG: 5'-methylthioadenosine/S-adenosylhomocysteine nucleosidase [Proteobacteria bacterium]|nr:5'-methylthioadenosine/S-adenosylhomocysteine nucleosidase [Pseudomonadota bacterium]
MSIEPRVLLLAPLRAERALIIEAVRLRHPVAVVERLRVACEYVAAWRVLLAHGGHGKVQLGIQTQYLIDQFPSAELVMCVGAAGGLDAGLAIGDVVVGTETIEHDHRAHFVERPLPRFPGHAPSVLRLRRTVQGLSGFRVAFDRIASGDEDVVTNERAHAVRAETGAACVAWEGSGAARAACFNGLGSIEIRAVTDSADKAAPQAFEASLPMAMANLALVLGCFFEEGLP